MLLRLDGIPYRVAGFRLSTTWEQVGVSWDGHRLAVVLGADSVMAITSTAPADRSGWGAPGFGIAGTAHIQWIVIQRGGGIGDWLRKLWLLSTRQLP